MKSIASDKFAAVFVAVLAIAASGVCPKVRAIPVFPPSDVSQTAAFRVSTAGAATFKSPGWCRTAVAQATTTASPQ